MSTLIQVQQDAIDYINSRKRQDFRVARKAAKMIKVFCAANGYTIEQTTHAVRDMFDVRELEVRCGG